MLQRLTTVPPPPAEQVEIEPTIRRVIPRAPSKFKDEIPLFVPTTPVSRPGSRRIK